jgi:hypothetical protein
MLDEIAKLDEILSMEELADESWELSVLKSYIPQLEVQLREIFRDCKVEPYDPTTPNEQEVKQFGREKAKLLSIAIFCDRAERKQREAWPKAAAFYGHLLHAVNCQD